MPRKLVVLLLVLLLPLQFAWAAAAQYCQHERDPMAGQHLGHHEHVHTADAAKGQAEGQPLVDNDCGVCHATGFAMALAVPRVLPAVAVSQQVARPPDARPTFALQEAPYRPQRRRLA